MLPHDRIRREALHFASRAGLARFNSKISCFEAGMQDVLTLFRVVLTCKALKNEPVT